MDKKELARFFADYWRLEEKEVTDDLKLDDKSIRGMSSIKFYKFIAAIESNFGIQVGNPNRILKFGDIMRSIR